MCYSAMVQQNAKKLGLRFDARVQTELYDELFSRRLNGEKLYINRGMEKAFLDSSEKSDKATAKKILEWHESEITRLEKDLFAQKKRLADAERILKSEKPTKKSENDKRIATDKIEKFKKDLERHKNLEKISDSDSRIYPFHYVSMLTVDERGNKIVMPIRYHMRPASEDESFDRKFYGCYNARFDNLSRVAWWKSVLGKRHGIILVKKFYENVETKRYLKNFKLDKDAKASENIVLCFEPEDTEYMFIPVIWDMWQKKGSPVLYSGALITDEPAPEIQEAGHDRTPIFLKEDAIDAWLNARGDAKHIKEILQLRENPTYKHQVVGAA